MLLTVLLKIKSKAQYPNHRPRVSSDFKISIKEQMHAGKELEES